MDNRKEQLKWFARGYRHGRNASQEISAVEAYKRNPRLPSAFIDHYLNGFSDGLDRDDFRMKLNGLA
jgi:hypothetical protein